jgi:membrane-associated protein
LIKNHIDSVLVLIVAASLVPMGIEYLLHRKRQAELSEPK